MQGCLRKYSQYWEEPSSGKTQDQMLFHLRKILYIKDIIRRARNRINATATEKAKNGDFKAKYNIINCKYYLDIIINITYISEENGFSADERSNRGTYIESQLSLWFQSAGFNYNNINIIIIIIKDYKEWEATFNYSWFPTYWLVFTFLGDPSVAQHPLIDEFVPLRLKNPVSTSTGPTVEPMDLVKELEHMRATSNKANRRHISEILDKTSTTTNTTNKKAKSSSKSNNSRTISNITSNLSSNNNDDNDNNNDNNNNNNKTKHHKVDVNHNLDAFQKKKDRGIILHQVNDFNYY
jgi:hypothetical protein